MTLCASGGDSSSSSDEDGWLGVLEDAAQNATDDEEPTPMLTTRPAPARPRSSSRYAGSGGGGGGTEAAARSSSTMSRRAQRRQRQRRQHTAGGPVRDAAELLAERQEARYTAMVQAGTHTPAEIEALRKQQRHREEVHVCRLLIRSRAWETDCSCSARDTYLCLAAALAGLNRRQDAIHTLQQALGSLPQRQYLRGAEAGAQVAEEEAPLGAAGADVAGPLSLALAKLLFQAGRKAEAFELTTNVLSRYTGCGGCRAGAATDAAAITVEEAAEAYQLGGWIQIHSDDHTSAYDIWSRGHHALPSCPFLARQAGKRACWDHGGGGGGGGDGTGASGAGRRRLLLLRDAELACGLVGDGAHGSGTFDRGADLEAFAVPAGRPASALALFEASSQRRELVFRTRRPLLTRGECRAVLREVERFHAEERGGRWGTVRTSSVKTTDVAVEDIPRLRPWLRTLLESRLWPMLGAAYPVLADGSGLRDGSTGEWRLRLHDAFIVRYDAEVDGSLSLPEHRDTSSMSFTLALNSREDGEFDGGGTWFEALGPRGVVVDAAAGHACAFAGPLRHAGYPITRGTRVILVLFCYVEGFPYGRLVRAYEEEHGPDCAQAAAAAAAAAAPSQQLQRARYVPAGWATHYPSANRAAPGSCGRDADDEKEPGAGEATACRQPGGNVRPSGDAEGGYVIYQQTTALVTMLQREVASVLD